MTSRMHEMHVRICGSPGGVIPWGDPAHFHFTIDCPHFTMHFTMSPFHIHFTFTLIHRGLTAPTRWL